MYTSLIALPPSSYHMTHPFIIFLESFSITLVFMFLGAPAGPTYVS
jgi:hypothetical protein